MTDPQSLIIDTDPGQDDAVAILLALASPQINLLGITAVAGNVPLAHTEVNARKICDLAGRQDIKVFAGLDRPLVRNLVTAEHVHGGTGLDGPVLGPPETPLQDMHAVDYIIQTLRNEPANSVTIAPIGPLSNVAMAMRRAPDIISRIRQIVLMGGGYFEGGNITPAAEFNIFVDPHAAEIVFNSGVPITMMPLDVTHKALTHTERTNAFRNLGNKTGVAVAEMLEFFERFDESKYGSDGAPLHDPCTIAWMTEPEIFSGRQCNVEIETGSELTMGMTVIDWWQVSGRPHNALVAGDLNADRFFELITERLATLP
ncbi:MAG: nucleoside hydrolase [Bacteroidetes bacterium]|nr:nucleoside hydrolase [Bacteroidota bacterium]